jgi:sugar/nucleoside kinase (ribokinase family)
MQATTYLTGERIQQALTNIQTQQAAEGKNVPIVVLDGNLEPSCITQAFAYCAQRQIPAWYEPTSFVKSTRVWPSWQQGAVQFLSPSDDELVVMHEFIKKQDSLDVKATLARYSAGISEHTLKSMCKAVLRDIGRDVHTTHHIIVTRAAQGVCIASYVPSKALFEFTSLPAIPARQVVNASGAGDSFVAGTVYALLKLLPSTETLLNVSHTAVVAAVRTGGLPAGTLTVESAQSVTSLTPQALAKCRQRRPTASKLTSNL